jgi:diguanylate cyclase (GGDEF)-like protein
MQINFTLYYLFVAIAAALSTSFYAWRNPHARGSRAFAAACLISTAWMTGEFVGRLGASFDAKWAGEIIRFFGVTLMPVAMLVFARQYCGRDVNAPYIKSLFVIPFASWLMMLTNASHGLFFKSVVYGSIDKPLQFKYGAYFWFVHLPYSYAILAVCLATIVVEASRASRHYRKQILLLFVSFCIPLVVNALGIFGVTGTYTALSFPLFFSIMAYAIFRHQFLGSNPIAYETVFQTIRDGVLILDCHDVVRDVNPAAAASIGRKPGQVVGLHLREAFKDLRAVVELYDRNPLELGEVEIELSGAKQYLSIDSTPLVARDSAANGEGRIITIRDNTDRHMQQLSLESWAFHDSLTRLANRRKFEEEVTRAIERAAESGQPLGILYFDLNRFKAVNDTLGHAAGDELLKYVAARVASILRKPDLLARLGGDEFALLICNCDEDGARIVAERLLDNVRRPFTIGEHTLVADLSIGAAFYPRDGENFSELLAAADAAMYRAKQGGESHFYESDRILETFQTYS